MGEVNKKEGYRSILEMGPLLLFFGVNYFYGIMVGTTVLVVSTLFEKKSLVKRHQIIYGLLAYELKNGLHALALNTYTPDEWSSNSNIPESPNCIGGGL